MSLCVCIFASTFFSEWLLFWPGWQRTAIHSHISWWLIRQNIFLCAYCPLCFICWGFSVHFIIPLYKLTCSISFCVFLKFVFFFFNQFCLIVPCKICRICSRLQRLSPILFLWLTFSLGKQKPFNFTRRVFRLLSSLPEWQESYSESGVYVCLKCLFLPQSAKSVRSHTNVSDPLDFNVVREKDPSFLFIPHLRKRFSLLKYGCSSVELYLGRLLSHQSLRLFWPGWHAALVTMAL